MGALHVLGLAVFAGSVLSDAPELRRLRWIGLAVMILTGALLFAANPVRTYNSWFFWMKVALLGALAFVRGPRWLVVGMWAAVIAASRGIAYY